MYLGIDIGTSSVKAILTDGSTRISDKADYPFFCSGNEQNPYFIEQTVRTTVARLLSMNHTAATNLKGLSICGHGPSILLIDKSGIPLTNLVTWQDKRALAEAQWLRANFKDFYKDSTSYEAKVLWFFKQFPEHFSDSITVLYPKDYILYKLCGRRIIDRSAASTIFFYDAHASKWGFDKADIPNHVFPQAVDSFEQVEVTGTEFSRLCGLPDGIPVFAGGIDAYCEALGAGSINPGDLVEGTGTSTCISLCQEESPCMDLHVVPGRSLIMRSISYTGGSVKWYKSLCAGTGQLDDIEYKPVKLIFLPYLIGERSPIWDEKASGVFFGLTEATTGQEMYWALMQGVSFAIKQNIDSIEKEHSAREFINAVGGGANNFQWLQLKANITGKVYNKLENTDAAAFGAAIIAAAGRGEESLSQITARWVKVEKEIIPDNSFHKFYEDLYGIYCNLYPALKDCFHQLADLNKI
ncbi:MAG: FGGY family carbohydrate kinase [Bacillota bacterium]